MCENSQLTLQCWEPLQCRRHSVTVPEERWDSKDARTEHQYRGLAPLESPAKSSGMAGWFLFCGFQKPVENGSMLLQFAPGNLARHAAALATTKEAFVHR
ncbi:hypothetical protein MRX96_058379 [Rhipicephalus microplus]